MKILINNSLKKHVQIENRKNRRGIYNLWIFEKFSLVLVIILSIMFPIYCKLTGSFVSTDMRTGSESYFLVAMFTTLIAGMGLVFVLLVSVLRKCIENSLIGGRVDEVIEILDDKLFYTFRIKYQTYAEQRNLVVVDLKRIRNINYDKKLYKINVEGMMTEKIVDVSFDVHEVNVSEMTDCKVEFWDYFTPSLYEILKTK